MPAYNEAARLSGSLEAVLSYVRNAPDTEIIVVDDGSTDATAAIAERTLSAACTVPWRVLRSGGNRGKGHAVRTGLLAARTPIGIFSDADLSTPLTELPKLLEPIERGEYDLTFGSRALDRSLIGVHQPRLREWGGRLFNTVLRTATGLPFQDTQCGFKAFRMSVCRPLVEAARVDRFGFDVELLFEARARGLRLLEVPVQWNHCEGSKVNLVRDGLQMLHEVSLIRMRSVRRAVWHGRRAAWTHSPSEIR